MRELKTVILAAGKGTRMRVDGSDLPKVMREALGRPLLAWVLDAVPVAEAKDAVLVVGYKQELVRAAFPDCLFAEQTVQLGTGHAVQCAAPLLEGFDGDVLITYGDMPLIRRETYEALLEEHRRGGYACTLLSGRSDEELPYGRVVRDGEGRFLRIVEDRDCTPEEKRIRELNVGVYVFDCKKLLPALGKLRQANDQKEFYLTDVPQILLSEGEAVGVSVRDMGKELIGVNTPEQLQMVEAELRGRA